MVARRLRLDWVWCSTGQNARITHSWMRLQHNSEVAPTVRFDAILDLFMSCRIAYATLDICVLLERGRANIVSGQSDQVSNSSHQC